MEDIRRTIDNREGWIEAIIEKIPFYKGYKEKEEQREADQILREHIANQLAEKLSQGEDIASQMLIGPGLSQLDEMGRGNTRLQTLIDKIKTAAQGYTGVFDTVKVKEDELDILYEFDHALLVQVDKIEAALDNIQVTIDEGGQLAPAVRRYIKTVTDASKLFDKRKDAILGLA